MRSCTLVQPDANTPYVLPLMYSQPVSNVLFVVKVILIFICFSTELRNGGDCVGAVHCDSTAGTSLLPFPLFKAHYYCFILVYYSCSGSSAATVLSVYVSDRHAESFCFPLLGSLREAAPFICPLTTEEKLLSSSA